MERRVFTQPPLASLKPSPSSSQTAVQPMSVHDTDTCQGVDIWVMYIGKSLSIGESEFELAFCAEQGGAKRAHYDYFIPLAAQIAARKIRAERVG